MDVVSPLAAGSVTLRYSYLTNDSTLNLVRASAFVFDQAACSGGISGVLIADFVPVADGEWHDVFTTDTLSGSGQSMGLSVGLRCSSSCSNPATAYFDDLVVTNEPPTAVRIASVRAARTGRGVAVRWQTTSETTTLGFNLYRQQHGKLVKLNRELIPSVFGGTARGHTYSWLDRNAPRSVRYRLQAVSLSGTRTWVGSASVS